MRSLLVSYGKTGKRFGSVGSIESATGVFTSLVLMIGKRQIQQAFLVPGPHFLLSSIILCFGLIVFILNFGWRIRWRKI